MKSGKWGDQFLRKKLKEESNERARQYAELSQDLDHDIGQGSLANRGGGSLEGSQSQSLDSDADGDLLQELATITGATVGMLQKEFYRKIETI
jgi:hypothetical protein